MFYDNINNDPHNNYVNSVIIEALAGDSLGDSTKYRKMAEQIMTPSKNDSRSFNKWYNSQGFDRPYAPANEDYNMYGFWKASQIPNSGASTQINPNDNRIHYTDTYLNPNGQYIRLKMPWHNNAWTTPAFNLLQSGKISKEDINKLNEWNRQRLTDKYKEYQQYGGW